MEVANVFFTKGFILSPVIEKIFLPPPPLPQTPQKRGELWNFLPHVLLRENFSAIKRNETFLNFLNHKK